MFLIDSLILGTGILLLLGIASSKLSNRLGVPVLVLFLVLGMLAGSDGIGGIEFENYRLAHGIGTLALAMILFDGGLSTPISNYAEHAIPYAVGLAERSVPLLKLVHVHLAFEAMDDLEPLYIDHATLQSFKRRKESYLNEVRRRISEVSSVRVSPYVLTGHEVSASLREVDLFQADLVIIATHARGPIGRFWSGSVVHRLLRQVDRPIMLVRGDKTAPGFAAKEIGQILIPLDGTSSAEQVLEPAVTLGGIVHAKHTLMQVVRLEPEYLIRHGSLAQIGFHPSNVRRNRDDISKQ